MMRAILITCMVGVQQHTAHMLRLLANIQSLLPVNSSKLHCVGKLTRPDTSTPAASAGTRKSVVQAVMTSVACVRAAEESESDDSGSTPAAVSTWGLVVVIMVLRAACV